MQLVPMTNCCLQYLWNKWYIQLAVTLIWP